MKKTSNLKQPKCKNCKQPFTKTQPLQVACSYSCAIELAKPIAKKVIERKWNERKRVYKESKTDYFKLLQTEINKIARLIDYNQLCISCQKVPKKINGCHFLSVGGHKSLRYNLFNIYAGCEKCNSELGGNIHGFDSGLILVFGKEFWEYLKFQFLQDFHLLQIRETEVKEKLKIARQIVKELESDLIKRNSDERLEMRKICNERLGIYSDISYLKVK